MYALTEAHRYCVNHKAALQKDQKCGYFYCLSVFAPEEIDEWIDLEDGGKGTALCPYCGVDSVMGESSGYPITQEFLRDMHEYWF